MRQYGSKCFRFNRLAAESVAETRYLLEIAQAFKAQTQDGDTVARIGGEEFVVLLPNTQPEGARIVADNILRAFNASSVLHAECTIPVSVSIGIASIFPAEREGHDKLLVEADRQLYLAKQGGRNQVAFAG